MIGIAKTFKKIADNSLFGKNIFTPRSAMFKASPRLCVCDLCKHVPGSCNLFHEYEITVGELNLFCLHSDVEVPVNNVGNQDDTSFIILNSYVAVRPESITDVFWVFKVFEPNRVNYDTDDKSKIPPGMYHISGYFHEKEPQKNHPLKKLCINYLTNLVTFTKK